jgi:diguanylate cyclase (GGDEF)-like protein
VLLTIILAVLFSRDKHRFKEYTQQTTPTFFIVVAVCLVFFTASIIVDFIILKKTTSIGVRLTRMAYIDKLTGLPNRYSCDVLLESFDSPEKIATTGFVLMQIKNLIAINNTDGHDNGNWLIAEFCSILEEVSEDHGYVGRNGGNEFLLVIEDCDSTAVDMFLLNLTKRIHGYNEMNVGTPLEISYSRVLNRDEHLEKISELLSLCYKRLRETPQTLS